MSCCGSSSIADRREGKPYSMPTERQAQTKAREQEISNYANKIVCVQQVNIPKITRPSGLLTGIGSPLDQTGSRSRSSSLQGWCGSRSPSESPRSRSPSEQDIRTLSNGMPLGKELSDAEGAIDVLDCMGAADTAETLRSMLLNLPMDGNQGPLHRQSTVSPTAAEQILKRCPVSAEYRTPPATLLGFNAFQDSVPGAVPDAD